VLPALRLGVVLWGQWYLHGQYAEGRAWLEEALALASEPTGVRARSAADAGHLATLTRSRGDLDAAWHLGERARDLHRQLGNRVGEGMSTLILASVAEDRGEYDRACRLCSQGLAAFRERGHAWGAARSLSGLARSTRDAGDAVSALPLFEEAVPALRILGDRQGLAWGLVGLGLAAKDLGDRRRACTALPEAVTVAREVGDDFSLARGLDGFATLVVDQDAACAVRLAAAASAVRGQLGATIAPEQRLQSQRVLDKARRSLDEAAHLRAWQAGATLTLDQSDPRRPNLLERKSDCLYRL
jgi:non-specific serine/threonine protein kinase